MDELVLEYFIKNAVFFALAVVTFVVFKLILNKTKLNTNKGGNVLKYPLAYRLAPLTTVGFFAVVTLLVYIVGGKDWIYIMASGIVAVGGLLVMLSWSLWKVVVKEDCFVYTNCFGSKHKYMYKHLELKESKNGTKWGFFSGELKIFTMPYFIQGRDKLLDAYYSYKNKHK